MSARVVLFHEFNWVHSLFFLLTEKSHDAYRREFASFKAKHGLFMRKKAGLQAHPAGS